MQIVRLTARVRDYDWGRTDKDNMVLSFSGQPHQNKKYAELWMGSHTSCPSLVNNICLNNYLKDNQIQELDYLFKILSIEKCLSIQAHPSKAQAQQLHLTHPNLYPDPNDKPEMFLTLSNFECLMGFISDEELKELLSSYPFNDFKSTTIKQVLAEILKLPEEEIKKRVKYLVDNEKKREKFIRKANEQFPNDVGILVSMILQYRELPPGQAYYIKAGQPHAYIYGECLELMKNSDNVVRLGLTPKHKDVDTLLKILDYDNRQIERLTKNNGNYQAGQLILTQILADQQIVLKSTSIGMVLQGSFIIGKFQAKHKDIVLIPAGTWAIKGAGKLYVAGSI